MGHIQIIKPKKPQKPADPNIKTTDIGLSCIPSGNSPDH